MNIIVWDGLSIRFHCIGLIYMKFRAFWDISPCSFLWVDQSFRGAYCLHHQGDEYTACERLTGYIGIGRSRWNFGRPVGKRGTIRRGSKPVLQGGRITLMMEAVSTSEISVYSNKTTRRYIPEGSRLHIQHRENLKSHAILIYFWVKPCNSATPCPPSVWR
jgi:hypothetical protein